MVNLDMNVRIWAIFSWGKFSFPSHRELYSQFLKEMIIQPGIAKANLGLSREDVTMEDHVSQVFFVVVVFFPGLIQWSGPNGCYQIGDHIRFFSHATLMEHKHFDLSDTCNRKSRW